MKKRLLSILLLCCMLLTLLPVSVLAEDAGTSAPAAIQAGIGNIDGYDATTKTYDYIYYGTWNNNPVKWRVLDTKDNTGADNALFLLADECMGSLSNGYIQFNPADKANRQLWQGSTAQTWCIDFYNKAFSNIERELIPAVTKEDANFDDTSIAPMYFNTGKLDNDHVFAPSIEEITSKNYGFSYGPSIMAGPFRYGNALGTRYWLRSYPRYNPMPHFVGEYANLTGDQIADRAAIRPAMNLTTKYANNCIISRISAAVGGKPAGGLQPIGTYDGNEWKLTLLDRSRDCGILAAPVSTTNYGGDIKIGYVHAPTGPNEYIAVEIMDDDLNPIYYGRSTESLSEASGTATIPVAAGLEPGEYTLLIFNEQYNGDYKTDLRSGYVSVTLTVNEAETYTVTYDPGKDGTGTSFTDTKIEGIDLTLSSRKFTRDGYVQTGWATIDGGEKVFNFGDIYSKDEAITLYPVWMRQYDLEVNGIPVTEGNKDDVLGDGKKQVTFEYSEYTDEYDFPVRKGILTLNGVDLSIDSDELIYCGRRDFNWLEIVLVGENKLSAEADTIHTWCYGALSFSGSGSLSVKAAYGDAIVCEEGLLYVMGGDVRAEGSSHAFASYQDTYIGVTGGSLTLIGSDKAIFRLRDPELEIGLGDYGVMLTSESTDGSDAAVTAASDVWTVDRAKYIRIFDKNVPITYNPGTNGTGEEYKENKTYGTDYSLKSDAIFTRTGYTLSGWATEDGGEKVYELGGTYSGNEPLTLYPVWTINQYTITFDTDGGTPVDSITQDYGTPVTAPDAPSKTGYTFNGWDTEIPATMPAEDLTITAQWSLNTYSITYDLDGGTATGNPASYTVESGEITLNAPEKTGYTFTGWSGTDLTGEDNLAVVIPTGSTGDRSYMAHWSLNVYSITYDLDGGTATGNPDSYTVESGEITLNAPEKTGYTFTGWSGTDLTGENNLTVTIPAGSIGDRSYTAHWSLNVYSITYDLDGGTATGNPDSYTVESGEITLNAPEKTGYTFTGWSGTNLTGEDNLTVTIPAGSIGDRSYTAHWSLNTYSITYDLNGGTATGNPDFYTVESSTITLNPPTRTGYTFTGWSGTELTGSDNLTVVIPAGSIGNRSYTAHWSLNTYSITYDLDGGTAFGNPDSYTVESAAITLNEPTKAGYVFTGWSGTDLVGENNLTVTIPTGSTGDRRYTAHWDFDPAIIAALDPTPNTDFLDVSRVDWFYYDVRYVCENGLMNGTSSNRFSPYGTATRGMLVTILYRMENEPRCFGSAAFSDVKPGAYYEKAVIWAAQNDIVSGYTDGTFRPDAPVTREQLASILYRYTRYRGQDVSAAETTSLTAYNDAQAVSSYALPAMRWACGTGILQGANGKLNPTGLATRAQLAAMLHRYLTK